jgi:hypothetical protein
MATRHVGTIATTTSDEQGYCPHGTYVGGCGIDWMCGDCEMGNYDIGEYDTGTVVVSFMGCDGQPVVYRESPAHIEHAQNSADNWRTLPIDDLVVTVELGTRTFYYDATTDPLD